MTPIKKEAAKETTTDGVVTFLQQKNRSRSLDPIWSIAIPDLAHLQRDCSNVFRNLSNNHRETIVEEAARFSSAKERTHLPDSQVIALIVAWQKAEEGEGFGYSDMLTFSARYMQKPLSDRAIFTAYAELEALGFFERVEPNRLDSQVGRPRELFRMTNFGVVGLYLAIMTAKHLHACRRAKEAA